MSSFVIVNLSSFRYLQVSSESQSYVNTNPIICDAAIQTSTLAQSQFVNRYTWIYYRIFICFMILVSKALVSKYVSYYSYMWHDAQIRGQIPDVGRCYLAFLLIRGFTDNETVTSYLQYAVNLWPYPGSHFWDDAWWPSEVLFGQWAIPIHARQCLESCMYKRFSVRIWQADYNIPD